MKLQQTLYTHIQAMMRSSKKILKDIGALPYMLCKVELQERDTLNAFNELSYRTSPRMTNKHI